MTMDFAAAMRAAAKLTRAQKLMEATRVIQSALLLGRGPSEPAHEQGVEGRAIEPFTIDITPVGTSTRDVAGGRSCRDARTVETPSFGLDGLARVKPRKALEIPVGSQFLNRFYACAAGRRSYKLYVPVAHAGSAHCWSCCMAARRMPMTSRQGPA